MSTRGQQSFKQVRFKVQILTYSLLQAVKRFSLQAERRKKRIKKFQQNTEDFGLLFILLFVVAISTN